MGKRTLKDAAITWFTMAIGLFRPIPPPILGGIVPEDTPDILGKRVDRLVDDVQSLRRELRKKQVIK